MNSIGTVAALAKPSENQRLRKVALEEVKNWQNRHQLAAALGVSYNKHLVYYLFRLNEASRYKMFEIKKRGGGRRLISTPATGLKQVQRRLNVLLQNVYSPRAGANGFVPGRSIVTNAEAHVRSRWVANIDLEKFFDAINFRRVRGLFLAKPFELNSEVATLLAQICCYRGKLPQGAPTSPIISNLICGRLDAELKSFAKERGLRYTRYADDITFSTRRAKFPDGVFIADDSEGGRSVAASGELSRIVTSNGFNINPRKTRLLGPSDRQDVTGLTVNRFVNVPRRYIRNVRGAIHSWRKFGYVAAQAQFRNKYTLNQNNAELSSTLMGRIQWIGAIRGWSDSIYTKIRDDFNLLAEVKIPVKTRSWEAEAEDATWVIEDHEGISQGTAVFVREIGLVTCFHCVGQKPFIYHPSCRSAKYDVEMISGNETIDLALLSFPEEIALSSVEPSSIETNLRRGDEISLLGYPNHAAGKGLSIKNGSITSFAVKSGITRFNISASIVAGNSGGPVFNRSRRMIGVAVTGADNEVLADLTEEHGVIPLSALSHIQRDHVGKDEKRET